MGNNVFQSPFSITSAAINAALANGSLSLPAGAVGVPSLNFGNPLYGFYASSSSRIDVAINGQNRMRFTSDLSLGSAGAVSWSSGTSIGTADVSLSREAAGTLALNGGVNPQAQRVYNTFTDASNYERATFAWSGNVFNIRTENAGTGGDRILRLGSGSIIDIDNTTGTISMYRNSSSIGTLLNVNSTGLTSTALLFARLAPSINQASGTYTVLDINPTETSIGAGPHYLIQGRLGAGNNVFSVDRTGALLLGSVAGGGVTFKNNGGVEAQVFRADGTTPASLRASVFRTTGGTVAGIGTANGAGAGSIAYVSDATATTRQSIAAGGGSNKVLVYSDGTNWLIV